MGEGPRSKGQAVEGKTRVDVRWTSTQARDEGTVHMHVRMCHRTILSVKIY